MKRLPLRLFSLWFASLVAGCCSGVPSFCRTARQDCKYESDAPGAICVFDGRSGPYCAFPDDRCESHYRWGSFTISDIRCDCVEPWLLRADGFLRGD